jgi:hypothetical protein
VQAASAAAVKPRQSGRLKVWRIVDNMKGRTGAQTARIRARAPG